MRLRTIVAVLVLALLGACGGGGGGSGGTQPERTSTTISGTVATNTGPTGYVVQGNSLGSVLVSDFTLGTDGRYSITSRSGATPPFVITAFGPQGSRAGHYENLTSVALGGGTANVTPLTTLLVARLLNHNVSFDFSETLRDVQKVSESDIRAAQQQVVAYLLNRPSKHDGDLTIPVDVSAVTNFISMPFNVAAGDPYFEALKRLHDSLMDSKSLDGVSEHMLFGNDPPPDVGTMLNLDFVANCTAEFDDGTMPSGSTRIIVDAHGITFGNVDLPFETGDRLSISAGPSIENRWEFGFTSRQAGVSIGIAVHRVGRAVFSRTSQAGLIQSQCLPVGEVTLSGKHPSVTSLIRLLVASLTDIGFQCAGPITYPGFRSGANFVFIERNGAMEVSGPGGPRLHLPSLNISVNAPLVVAAGQVSPLRLTSFEASRLFVFGIGEVRIGSDIVRISVSAGGLIQSFSLIRKNEQSDLSQTCP